LSTLHRLQVTTRSALGALALNTGGVLIDHGWLRLLGGGYQTLPDLASANDLGEPTEQSTPPLGLEVAHDVLGGRFVIDGGGLGIGAGQVCYFAPDTLRWEGLGLGHGSFVSWACSPPMTDFYSDLRWAGWKSECEALSLGQGLSIYPPLFSGQAADIAKCGRAPVPVSELFALHKEMAGQLADLPEGSSFDIRPGL
jgi:hypothetical protein